MERTTRDPTTALARADAAVLTLAARQHGVVARLQLIDAGLSASMVDRRLATGRLRCLYRGVYLVPPLASSHTAAMAAALACGECAAVSHQSAAAIWQAFASSAWGPVVHVNSTRWLRRLHGIRVHRTRMSNDEVVRWHGIPVTTPARTLFDLAASATARELERLVAEMLAQRLTTTAAVLTLLTRYPRRPGASRLRALVGAEAEPVRIRSKAEAAFLALIRRSRLPMPEVNVMLAGYEVDFYWRQEQLVVEIDGFAFHSSRRSFEADRRRDAVLTAAGVRVMRVTWRQLESTPEAVLVRVALALRPAPATLGAISAAK